MDCPLDLWLQQPLRPRTLEQRRSEGQIEEQPREEDSEEDDTLEPLVIEGLPDELGPEWRVLHPFDIPGVRNPTEDTPPTHRRLAENKRHPCGTHPDS